MTIMNHDYLIYSCYSCHSIPSTVGPNLHTRRQKRYAINFHIELAYVRVALALPLMMMVVSNASFVYSCKAHSAPIVQTIAERITKS